MSKGKGGGNQAKMGISFNANHTTQSDGGLADKVAGLVSDSLGMIAATIISSLFFSGCKKMLAKRADGATTALTSGPADGPSEADIRKWVGKSIESVGATGKADFGKVREEFLTHNGYLSDHPNLNRIIGEELSKL